MNFMVSVNFAVGSGKNTPLPATYHSQIIWLHSIKHMLQMVNSLKYNKYILLNKSKQTNKQNEREHIYPQAGKNHFKLSNVGSYLSKNNGARIVTFLFLYILLFREARCRAKLCFPAKLSTLFNI